VTQYNDPAALARVLERGARDAQRAEHNRLKLGAAIAIAGAIVFGVFAGLASLVVWLVACAIGGVAQLAWIRRLGGWQPVVAAVRDAPDQIRSVEHYSVKTGPRLRIRTEHHQLVLRRSDWQAIQDALRRLCRNATFE
jgi:hypothetical protein